MTRPPRVILRRLSDDRVQAGIIALFFAIGAVGHVLLPEAMALLTPPVLWIFGILVLAAAVRDAAVIGKEDAEPSVAAGTGGASRRAAAGLAFWALATYAVTFALEAVGTATGLIFGPYDYGSVLGFSVFSVPLVIGFNWVLVALGAARTMQKLPAIFAVPAAAALCTGFDAVLEPVAIRLGYWQWHWDGVPPRNYLAWFLMSFAAVAALRTAGLRMRTRLPAFYIAIQAAFFAVLILATAGSGT